MAVTVSGFSYHLPTRCVTNHDLSQMMETDDEWITSRTGIKTRYWAEPPTTLGDLAASSARRTLEATGTTPDCIIFATLSSEYTFPGSGVLLQQKLELPQVPAFDLRNQCAGFLYGLEVAAAFVKSGQYKKVLLVGGEVQSTGLDLTTRGRDIAVLFGDGAGTCLVHDGSIKSKGVSFELLATEMHSDGQYAKELWCEHPGSANFPNRLSEEIVTEARYFPTMNGRTVFEHAVKNMIAISHSVCARALTTPSEVALFIPHQANIRINQMVGTQLKFKPEQCWNTIEQFGNTTAATIPIGFATAEEAGRFNAGDKILSAAFGSGFVWGGAVLRVL